VASATRTMRLFPCPAALDRPQGLTAANVTDASALLVWQPSVATVDGYVITYSADSGVSLLPCLVSSVP